MPKRERNVRKMKKKVCAFCAENAEYIDYKDVNKVKTYVTKKVKFYPVALPATALNISAL